MQTMNLTKNICYKVYVPVNYEKKDVGIATRVSESVKREIDRIADEHDRTPAYVIRELLTRVKQRISPQRTQRSRRKQKYTHLGQA